MSLKDNLKTTCREEAGKLKNMSRKDKAWYIWEYYKYPIIGTALALFIVISLGTTIYGNRYGTALSCVVINAAAEGDPLPAEDYFQNGFRQFAGIDEHPRIDVDHSFSLSFQDNADTQLQYAALTKITAMTASKELDVMIGDPEVMEHYGAMGGFMDLKQALPPELYQLVKDSVYTVKNVETGEEQICGIRLDRADFQIKTGFLIEDPVFAIMSNTTRTDTCIELLRYIVQK